MKKLITILAAVSLCAICFAEPPQTRHNVRLGWGDMLFETLAFHPSAKDSYDPALLPQDYKWNGTFDYGYTGHIFGEYMYSFTDLISAGIQTDFEGIFWKEGSKDNFKKVNNYNLCFLPSVRFTYFHSKWLDIYSGLSFGLLMAFDNQKQFEVAPAFNLNLVGAKVAIKDNWSGFLELGALNALKDANCVYMFGSRLISFGVNFTW